MERVPARAALAGNPSDGYGGAVLAVPVDAVGATVTVRASDGWSVCGAAHRWLDEVRAAMTNPSTPGLERLAAAAIDAFDRSVGRPAPCAIEVSTDIPESVGLAGSSAVVIGTLRGLATMSSATVDADRLAEVALSAEVDGLGIAAGLQDRIVQSRGVPMHMEFGERGRHSEVRVPKPVRLLVAVRSAAWAPSGATHAPLRHRWESGDRKVRRAMWELAVEARRATAALGAGDLGALGTAMDRTFDVRRSIIPLDPRHVEMIEVARDAGAAANFAGSGGSIVVYAPTDDVEARARSSLAALGCLLLDLPLP